MKTPGRWLLLAVSLVCLLPGPAARAAGETALVESAVDVLDEMSAIPEQGIPPALLHKAQGVAIFPSMIKAGFLFSARHGRGVLVARDAAGRWGNPLFLRSFGGSFGFQAGVQSGDTVLVLMTRRSVDALLRGKDFTLGADAAVAAGPIGRQVEADTDIRFQAEVLSYSRTKGAFLGVALGGTLIRLDATADADFYRRWGITSHEIMAGQDIPDLPAADKLKAALARCSAEPYSVAVAPNWAPVPASPAPAAVPQQPSPGQPVPFQQPPAVPLQQPQFQPVPAMPPPVIVGSQRETNIVQGSIDVIREVEASPDNCIPPALLKKAQGVAIFPNVVKGGFVIGGRFGRGLVVLKEPNGTWSNPLFMTLAGGSFGFQVGVDSTDVILVFMTRRSLESLLRRRDFTLGIDANLAVGPVGRQMGAATDIGFQAEVYSYSRSRGLFLGAAIDGSVLNVSYDANEAFYRRWDVSPSVILSNQIPAPAVAEQLRAVLQQAQN